MAQSARITAWQPPIPGLLEVLHADFPDHAYPMHTHDAWTLLLVDQGMVRYDLDRHQHGALTSLVTLLPPNVPHDGRSVRPEGFRKRVLYLAPAALGQNASVLDGAEAEFGPRLPEDLTGAAVDNPGLRDPLLRRRIHQLHDVLAWRTEDLEAQSRLLLIRERLHQHLHRSAIRPDEPSVATPARRDPGVAGQLRELLDTRIQPGLSLDEAARLLHSHPTHLVRAFSREYGMPPHLYLTGRRVDLARRHLLSGLPAADVATLAGFYDQSHLTRHFRRMLGITPTRFARPRPDRATKTPDPEGFSRPSGGRSDFRQAEFGPVGQQSE